MTDDATSDHGPEQLFDRVTRRFLADPTVTAGTGFGASPGVRVGTKIFAMLVRGELVVKLPRRRVDELVSSGSGARFDPGHGRPMKEWVSVPAERARNWEQLVREALEFVRPTTEAG